MEEAPLCLQVVELAFTAINMYKLLLGVVYYNDDLVPSLLPDLFPKTALSSATSSNAIDKAFN